MTSRTTVLSALAILSLTACFRSAPVAEIGPVNNVVASRWNATLTTPEAMQGAIQAQGRSWVSSLEDGRRTRVNVELSNMLPGGVHPWVLRTGVCGLNGTEILRVTEGNVLTVGNDGKAAAQADVELAFPSTGEYMVAVLASAANSQLVIACGNLAAPNLMSPR